MDQYSRAFYELKFSNRFMRLKAMAFQDFFADLMEKAYPAGDFIRVRPWGAQGDRKNDGYVRSRRMLFQVYAPYELGERATINKINEDFAGALPYWEKHFDTWVFVHNAMDGLPPSVATRLLELDGETTGIAVSWWGHEELRQEVFKLREEDIAALLGPAPSLRDFAQMGFAKLKPILDAIARREAPLDAEIGPVPRDKVEINRLSANVELLIQLGRRRSNVVRDFLAAYPDPQYGDEVVQAFRLKYEEVKNAGLTPDQIFQEVQIFAGGNLAGNPGHQAAVLTVVAYLFDQCDIFEGAKGE